MVVSGFLFFIFSVYFRHRNEEKKRPKRMIEKREKEERKREKEVIKIYFRKYILLCKYIILMSRIGK